MINDNIMTYEEIHEFGINIVLDDMRKNGFIITSVTTDFRSNPQIIAQSPNHKLHIIVRTACYPNKGIIESKELGFQLLQKARLENSLCYFASVGIANSQGTTDLEMSIPTRGAGFLIAYSGIEKLTPEKITSISRSASSLLYDKDGQISGSVVMQSDGLQSIIAGDKADGSTLLMTTCVMFANMLQDEGFREERILISNWAHLPQDIWTQAHHQEVVKALMHFFMEVKSSGGNISRELEKKLTAFPPQVLQELKYPLTNELREMFLSIFG